MNKKFLGRTLAVTGIVTGVVVSVHLLIAATVLHDMYPEVNRKTLLKAYFILMKEVAIDGYHNPNRQFSDEYFDLRYDQTLNDFLSKK